MSIHWAQEYASTSIKPVSIWVVDSTGTASVGDGGKHQTDVGLGIEAGYAYFLSRTVTIEPAVYYKWRFNDGDMSRFGVKIGFGFYL